MVRSEPSDARAAPSVLCGRTCVGSVSRPGQRGLEALHRDAARRGCRSSRPVRCRSAGPAPGRPICPPRPPARCAGRTVHLGHPAVSPLGSASPHRRAAPGHGRCGPRRRGWCPMPSPFARRHRGPRTAPAAGRAPVRCPWPTASARAPAAAMGRGTEAGEAPAAPGNSAAGQDYCRRAARSREGCRPGRRCRPLLDEAQQGIASGLEGSLRIVHRIQLVHREDDVRYAQQGASRAWRASAAAVSPDAGASRSW